MKKLMILGIMLSSLFTYGKIENNTKMANATSEPDIVKGSSATFCKMAPNTYLYRVVPYSTSIVSLKISNNYLDIASRSPVCNPKKIVGCTYADPTTEEYIPQDGVIFAYIFENVESTESDKRYDCVLYANVEKIYTSQSSFGMFCNFVKLETIDISILDTSKTENFNSMFSGCRSLKSIDISTMNTDNVTIIRRMFERCESLTSVNCHGLNTSKVESMDGMFMGCSSLTELNLSSFDTSNVTTIDNMFSGCTKLKKLDISSFDMTHSCEIDLISNTTNQTKTDGLVGFLLDCTSLEYFKSPNVLPVDSTIDSTHSITLPSQLANYYGVTKLTSDNIAQYKAFCIPGDEYAKKWRALRAENGDSICSLLTPGTEGNTKLTQLLAEHDAMDKNYQEYLYLVTDKENVTVGESITYVKNVLEGKQGTDGNYGLTDENKGSFMTMSISEESPYLIAIISLLGILAVLGYYFYNKKKQYQ